MTTQLLHIHGGTTFDTYDAYIEYLQTREVTLEKLKAKRMWTNTLSDDLAPEFDVLQPRMPNGTNAQYGEWVIWFERILPLLSDGVVLLGHSLGGIFLAKYLSEKTVPVRVRATILAAAPFSDTPDESLASFRLPASLETLSVQGGAIHLFHSTDDPVVPYTHAEAYRRALPDASLHTFSDRGHFLGETFPELLEYLRTLT